MADVKLEDMTEDTTPALTDISYEVKDPSGTPLDRKVTHQNKMKLAPHWVDRGDPASSDYEAGDLTMDSAWHDLDLSSIVPAGATMVALYVIIQDGATDSQVKFRKNGNSNVINRAQIRTQVVNGSIDGNMIVHCDQNRVIEYFINATLTICTIIVTGWYIDTVN